MITVTAIAFTGRPVLAFVRGEGVRGVLKRLIESGVTGSIGDDPAVAAAGSALKIPLAVEPADSPGCPLAVVPEPDGRRIAIPHRHTA